MNTEVSGNKHRYKRTVSVDPEDQSQPQQVDFTRRNPVRHDAYANQNGFSNTQIMSSYPDSNIEYLRNNADIYRRNVTESTFPSADNEQHKVSHHQYHSPPDAGLQTGFSSLDNNYFHASGAKNTWQNNEHINHSSTRNHSYASKANVVPNQDKREPFYETTTFRIKGPSAGSEVDDRSTNQEVNHYHEVGFRNANWKPSNEDKHSSNVSQLASSTNERMHYIKPFAHQSLPTTKRSFEKSKPEDKKPVVIRRGANQASVKDLIGKYSSFSQNEDNRVSEGRIRNSLVLGSAPHLYESTDQYSPYEERTFTANADSQREKYISEGKQQRYQASRKEKAEKLIRSSRSPSGQFKRQPKAEDFTGQSPKRSASLPSSPALSRHNSASDVSLLVKQMSSFPSGLMKDTEKESLEDHINEHFSESNLKKLSIDGQGYRASRQSENPSGGPSQRRTLWRRNSDQSLNIRKDETTVQSAPTRRSFPEKVSKELQRSTNSSLQMPQDSCSQRSKNNNCSENQRIPKNVYSPNESVKTDAPAKKRLEHTTGVCKPDPRNSQEYFFNNQGVSLHQSSREPVMNQTFRSQVEVTNPSELYPNLDVNSQEVHQPILPQHPMPSMGNQDQQNTPQSTGRKYSSGIPQGFIDGMQRAHSPNKIERQTAFSSSSYDDHSNEIPISSSLQGGYVDQKTFSSISFGGYSNQMPFPSTLTGEKSNRSSMTGGYPNQMSATSPLPGGYPSQMPNFPPLANGYIHQMPIPSSSSSDHSNKLPIPSFAGYANQMPILPTFPSDHPSQLPVSSPTGHLNQMPFPLSTTSDPSEKLPISPTHDYTSHISLTTPPNDYPNQPPASLPGAYVNEMPFPYRPNDHQSSMSTLSPGDNTNQVSFPSAPNQIPISPSSASKNSNKMPYPSPLPQVHPNQMPFPSSPSNEHLHQRSSPSLFPNAHPNQMPSASLFPSEPPNQIPYPPSSPERYLNQMHISSPLPNGYPNQMPRPFPFSNESSDVVDQSSQSIYISDPKADKSKSDVSKKKSKKKHSLDLFRVPQIDKNVTPYSTGLGEVQDFCSIRDQCLSKHTLWEDPSFPASNSSVTSSTLNSIPLQWKRPGEIVQNPRLFVDGASRFDVVQGELGDCWLLAAVANLTLNPSLFHHVVPRDQGFGSNYAGIFHFRFWQYCKWVDIVIDDRLPTYMGKLLFLHSKDANEFWSALLEKAYAKLHGSYEALKGGTSAEAMEDFSGGLTELYHIHEIPKNFCNVLLKAHERSSLITCSLESDPKIKEKQLANGLVKGHAYSITSIKRIEVKGNGEIMLLRIRNPWGNEMEWKGAWSDQSPEWNTIRHSDKKAIDLTFDKDGEFWMSYDDFIKNFEKIEICHLNPNSLENKYNKQWQTQVFEGQWIRGVTAGGCRNYLDTFWHNPQFRITLEEPDEHGGKCTIIVAVMQKNRRRQREEYSTIGFTIYHLKNPDALPKPLDYNFFKTNVSVARSPSFINTREVLCRFLLPAATYCIIPSTYEPNEEGQFIIRVFSEKRNTMQEHDEDIGTKIVEKVKEARAEDETQISAFFIRMADKNQEVDSFKLKQLLDSAFKNEFGSDGVSVDVCRSLVAMMDDDHSGKLSLHEFLTLWKNVRRWKGVFRHYDKDRSGHLDTFELREALNSAGYRLNSHILTVLTLRYGPEGSIGCDDFIMCAIKLKIMIDIFRRKTRKKKSSAKFSLEEWIETTMYC